MRRYWRLGVGVLVSLFFLLWAARLAGSFRGTVAALGEANYCFLFPALIAYFAGVWLRAMRWHVLLRPVRAVPPRRLFPVVVIGYMANDVLPARLGELVRAYILGDQERVAKTTTLGTIVIERLFDGLALLVFAGGVGLSVPLDPQVAGVVRLAAAVFLVALAAAVALGAVRTRAARAVELAERWLPPSVRGRLSALTIRFLEGLGCLQSGRLIIAVAALSLGAWLCEAAMYWILSLGFGLGLGFPSYLLTTAIANLGAMVPAAPGYIGTFDLGALASLRLFGADPARAAGFVVVLHLALLLPVSVLGFYYLWRFQLSLRMLGQRMSAARADDLSVPTS
jgi:uncharacterized protein (TIRG00374 family)